MKYGFSNSIAQEMEEIMKSEVHSSLFKSASKKCEVCKQDMDSCMCDVNYADSCPNCKKDSDSCMCDANYAHDCVKCVGKKDCSCAKDSEMKSSALNNAITTLLQASQTLDSIGLEKESFKILNLSIRIKQAQAFASLKNVQSNIVEAAKYFVRAYNTLIADSKQDEEVRKSVSNLVFEDAWGYNVDGWDGKKKPETVVDCEKYLNLLDKAYNELYRFSAAVFRDGDRRPLDLVAKGAGYLSDAKVALNEYKSSAIQPSKPVAPAKEVGEGVAISPAKETIDKTITPSKVATYAKYVRDLDTGLFYLIDKLGSSSNPKISGKNREKYLEKLNSLIKEIVRVYRAVTVEGGTQEMRHASATIVNAVERIKNNITSEEDKQLLPNFKDLDVVAAF